MITLLDRQTTAQNVIVNKNLESDLPSVALDGEQIEQVLLNLALNALQVMPGGGNLVFRSSQTKDTVAIEIEDTGGGIPTSVLGRIFDPFFTTKDKGSGLGLSIAHKIAVQHEGSLSAENTPQGAVFRLTLNKTVV